MKKYFIATLITIIIVGCGNNRKHDDCAHDEILQLTAYNADFELFAEATPFVVGQTSDIWAHFSHLENFKPLAEGKVTANLIVGTNEFSQTLEQPTQTGIYHFQLTPTTAGSGKIIFNIEISSRKSQIILSDITVFTNEHDAQHAAAEAVIESVNGVVFTKEQSWKVDFATEEIAKKPFGQIIRTTAQIQPSQGDEQIVVARTSGTVAFNANVTAGKSVNSGQTLFSIDGSATADNNLAVRFTEAESEFNRAKTEYERKAELAKENIVSQSDLLRARTEFTNAEANFNNLKRHFSAGRQNINSPIGGFVTRVLVQNGQFVEAGQAVLVVSQNRDLFLKAELQPRFFDLLGKITSANIRTLNNNRVYTLEELNGRVLSFGRSADMNNPLIPVVFQVNNTAGLLPGSFVEMFIKTQTNAQAITVPNEAIVEEMGNFFVFVQLTPEFFEKQPITKGVTDGIRTEITRGISAGDRIVSKGAIFVKLAQVSSALDPHAGHVH